MPTITQRLSEEITNELRNLKTDKDKDQVIINHLLKTIHYLGYDVYNSNIDADFKTRLNKLNNIDYLY